MKKKIFYIMLLLVVVISANAQFRYGYRHRDRGWGYRGYSNFTARVFASSPYYYNDYYRPYHGFSRRPLLNIVIAPRPIIVSPPVVVAQAPPSNPTTVREWVEAHWEQDASGNRIWVEGHYIQREVPAQQH